MNWAGEVMNFDGSGPLSGQFRGTKCILYVAVWLIRSCTITFSHQHS